MNKVIAIDGNDVTIGLANGEIRHFDKDSFNFEPRVNMLVDIYESNDETIVTPGAANQSDDLLSTRQVNSKLLFVAYILNLITTIVCGIFIITLAWMIPMTVISWRIYKGMRPNTTAFAVCTILFLNTISGVLMLVAGTESDNPS